MPTEEKVKTTKKQAKPAIQEQKLQCKILYGIGFACGKVKKFKDGIDWDQLTGETNEGLTQITDTTKKLGSEMKEVWEDISDAFKKGLESVNLDIPQETKAAPKKKTKTVAAKKKAPVKKKDSEQEESKTESEPIKEVQ